MKKTLTTILLSAGAFAAAAGAESDSSNTMLMYGNTYNLNLNADNVVKRQLNAGSTAGSASLTPFADGLRVTFNWNAGHALSIIDPAKAWTNIEALEDLNKTMRLNLTADFMSEMKYIGCLSTGTDTTLTLSFKYIKPEIDLSRPMTFYVLATSSLGSAGDLLVSGLSGYTVTSAAADKGQGFDNKKGGYNSSTLYKVTGKLQKGKSVTIATTTKKTAFALVAYQIPEPSTATLSLLALAGLAARRRRR